MPHSNRAALRQQVGLLRRQFLQDGDVPFTDILTEEVITQALTTIHGWLDRIFSPLVTLWVFLGQVLSADHSCRAAVARLIAHRLSRGQRPCSAQTGAYCQARQRLPEKFFSTVACSVGRALEARADKRWLWKGRRVYLFDGTPGRKSIMIASTNRSGGQNSENRAPSTYDACSPNSSITATISSVPAITSYCSLPFRAFGQLNYSRISETGAGP
jgi:hypothetical protein